MKKTILAISVTAVLLTACGGSGGGSGGGNGGASDVKTGAFVDTAVEGLIYKTDTQDGTTDKGGVFKYIDGEEVTFSLGEMELGKAVGTDMLTPKDINPAKEIQVATLLQSLDGDNELGNGIDVSGIDTANTTGQNFDVVDDALIQHLSGDPSKTVAVGVEEHLESVERALESISVSGGKLIFDSEFTQALADDGKTSVTNWLAIKDFSNGITTESGEAITSISGTVSVDSQTYTSGKNRAGVKITVYDPDDADEKYISIYFRLDERGSGLKAKSFGEAYDGTNYTEFVMSDTSGGFLSGMDATVGEVKMFSISLGADNKVTVGYGDKTGIFDLAPMASDIGMDTSNIKLGFAGMQTNLRYATVGDNIKVSFDDIKVNGALVDDFSDSLLNLSIWSYVAGYVY